MSPSRRYLEKIADMGTETYTISIRNHLYGCEDASVTRENFSRRTTDLGMYLQETEPRSPCDVQTTKRRQGLSTEEIKRRLLHSRYGPLRMEQVRRYIQTKKRVDTTPLLDEAKRLRVRSCGSVGGSPRSLHSRPISMATNTDADRRGRTHLDGQSAFSLSRRGGRSLPHPSTPPPPPKMPVRSTFGLRVRGTSSSASPPAPTHAEQQVRSVPIRGAFISAHLFGGFIWFRFFRRFVRSIAVHVTHTPPILAAGLFI